MQRVLGAKQGRNLDDVHAERNDPSGKYRGRLCYVDGGNPDGSSLGEHRSNNDWHQRRRLPGACTGLSSGRPINHQALLVKPQQEDRRKTVFFAVMTYWVDSLDSGRMRPVTSIPMPRYPM
jgi:hypothetical protein